MEAIPTGDDLELGGYRKLQSAEELPVLGRLVTLGLAAGVGRRNRGRLVAVATFAKLDEVAAHEKVVRAAVETGLSAPHGYFMGHAATQAVVDASVVILLAELLDAGSAGIEVDELVGLMHHLVPAALPAGALLSQFLLPSWAGIQLERLEQPGVVALADSAQESPDCDVPHRIATLTAAGVPIAVELAREIGIEVAVRPDPADADAASIADLIGQIPPEEWQDEASAWFAAQPAPVEAADRLITEITAESREPIVVMLGLQAEPDVVGDLAVPAIRRRMGGSHDGLVLHWLSYNADLDPESVDPARLIAGLVDVLAAALDIGGPADVLRALEDGDDTLPQLIDTLWRMEHPRVAQVLEVFGAHHPDKAVAKAARKALMKHRNR